MIVVGGGGGLWEEGRGRLRDSEGAGGVQGDG